MPDAAQSVPLFGFGVGTKSSNVSAQMRVNMYVEVAQDDDKAHLAYYGRPAMSLLAEHPQGMPCDGALPYAVTATVATPIGSVAGTPGPIYFSGGNLQSFMADGSAAGSMQVFTGAGRVRSAMLGASPSPPYVSVGALAVSGGEAAQVAVGPMGAITGALLTAASGFPFGSQSVTCVASRFVAVDPSAGGRFRWSGVNVADSWGALDFATADAVADALVAVFEAWGELLLFGSSSIEFWSPYAGGASGQQPFIRIPGATLQWGTDAIDSICKTANTVTFLGRAGGGRMQVVELSGYTATVVSTPQVEASIAASGATALASAFFVASAGHQFYVLNLSGVTWAFDVTTRTWAEWRSGDVAFAARYPCIGPDALYLASATDPGIYVLDPDAFEDTTAAGTVPIKRQIVSKHAWANLARLSLRELAIDCETGVGLDGIQQGTTPQLMLQWSKDGGHTWGNEAWVTLGAIGRYLARAVWRGLGRSRDWVFRLTVTDPVKVVVIDAAAIFSP